MAKRGRPRKNPIGDESLESKPTESVEVKPEVVETQAVETPSPEEPVIKKAEAVGFEIPDGVRISVSPVMEPSLANSASDPFQKFKTDPDRFHYRALNKKPQNVSIKEAMGYQPIGGSEFGDLVLAKIPKERRQMREQYHRTKAENQIKAAQDTFRDKAKRNGFETFDAVNEKKK